MVVLDDPAGTADDVFESGAEAAGVCAADVMAVRRAAQAAAMERA
jgi:hypothetical protein